MNAPLVSRTYRTIFISDLHLGTRGCRSDFLLDFLRRTECRQLYLVGDVVDGWRLRRSWYWDETHDEILRVILAKARGGTQVTYITGNHDELFRACAEAGGLIGVSLFSPGLAAGNDATVEDYLDAMEHVIGVVGENHVGIGTDFSLGHARPGPWMLWANRDKGTARTLTEFGTAKISKPKGIERIRDMPNVTAAMVARGWSEARITRLLGGNWLRVLRAGLFTAAGAANPVCVSVARVMPAPLHCAAGADREADREDRRSG